MYIRPKISLIVAVDLEGGIGKGGEVPWRLGTDLERFKELTLDKPVLLGRKTYESIGRPLPGRETLVLTMQAGYNPDGVKVFNSVRDAVHYCELQGDWSEIMVAGGAEVYKAMLPSASCIYLTKVFTHGECDVEFPGGVPDWDDLTLSECHRLPEKWRKRIWFQDGRNDCNHSFRVLER